MTFTSSKSVEKPILHTVGFKLINLSLPTWIGQRMESLSNQIVGPINSYSSMLKVADRFQVEQLNSETKIGPHTQ